MKSLPVISLVSPFYNEEDVVQTFCVFVQTLFNQHSEFSFEMICVDDGSKDETLSKLISFAQYDSRFRIIELSRNFGKEAALTAGLDYSTGDAVIPLDADLQDPPELIFTMIEQWQKGADVVIARRIDRQSDHYTKRKTAEWFYKIHNLLSSIKLPENVGDFRLMDRAVVNALKQLPEQQRFMKGLFAWVGFKTISIDYVRPARQGGHSKFSGWKLWNFALEGITSFSAVPLRLWTYIGLLGALTTLFYATYIICRTMLFGIEVPGYASLVVIILFFSSLQLMSIGILGEYIGRIYIESKRRPLYLVRQEYKKTP